MFDEIRCSVCHKEFISLLLGISIYKINNEYFKDCYVCINCLCDHELLQCDNCGEWDKFENLKEVKLNGEHLLIHEDEIEDYKNWLRSFN